MHFLPLVLAMGCRVPESPAATPAVEPAPGMVEHEDVALLERAVAESPHDAMAHYRLARRLAFGRAVNEQCRIGASRERILGLLEGAVSLDREAIGWMESEAAFDTVRDTIRYRLLVGGDLSSAGGVDGLLTGTTFHSPPVDGKNLQRLEFHPAHEALVEVSTGDTSDAYIGTWRVDGTDVQVDVGGENWTLNLDSSGDLHERGVVRWVNTPAECLAR